MKNRCPLTRIALFLLIALASLVTLPAVAEQDEDRERTLTIERLGQGNCPHAFRLGKDGPEIMRLGSFGYLGVSPTALTPELRAHFGVPGDAGVMIGRVEDDSPAAAAGLRVGDIITRLDDEDVASGGRLRRLVRRHEKDEEVTLEYWRGGKVASTTVALGEHQRCGFDISSVIDLENLPHLKLENLRIDLENLPELDKLRNLEIDLEKLPKLGHLMELHEFDGEALEEMQERLRDAFESQDWESHLERIRDVDLHSIEERLHEAMDRLHELEDHIRVEKDRIQADEEEHDVY